MELAAEDVELHVAGVERVVVQKSADLKVGIGRLITFVIKRSIKSVIGAFRGALYKEVKKGHVRGIIGNIKEDKARFRGVDEMEVGRYVSCMSKAEAGSQRKRLAEKISSMYRKTRRKFVRL